jgi:hypothetical protein
MKIQREFKPVDRYVFDFKYCTTKKGFAQVDTGQDAWYFGTWTNPEKMRTVNYCEGDITISDAETADEYVDDLRAIKRWNLENGHRFCGIDSGFNEGLKEKFVDLGLGDLLH